MSERSAGGPVEVETPHGPGRLHLDLPAAAEPSLVLLTDTNLAMPADGAAGARFIGGSGCRVALVRKADEPAFRSELLALGVQAERVNQVRGLNVNRGKVLDIGVWLKR